MYKKILAVCLVLVMCIPAFSGMNVHSGENEQTDKIELPPLENWHYRVPLIVNAGDYNRTDCIVSEEINVIKEIGGFGSFDNNSVRVIETNETGSPLWEIASQFELCDIPEISSSAITYANPEAGNNIDREIDKLSYTRAILIFSACASGTAIHGTDEHPEWNLKDNNRIILTDTDKNEESYSEWWWPGDRHDHSAFLHDHSAFLYEGHLDFILLPDDLDSYYSGFLKNMENTNDPRSVKYAYDKGNEAATHNEESPGKIYESHPQITLPDLASKTYW